MYIYMYIRKKTGYSDTMGYIPNYDGIRIHPFVTIGYTVINGLY